MCYFSYVQDYNFHQFDLLWILPIIDKEWNWVGKSTKSGFHQVCIDSFLMLWWQYTGKICKVCIIYSECKIILVFFTFYYFIADCLQSALIICILAFHSLIGDLVYIAMQIMARNKMDTSIFFPLANSAAVGLCLTMHCVYILSFFAMKKTICSEVNR